jgi:hypothetical protein
LVFLKTYLAPKNWDVLLLELLPLNYYTVQILLKLYTLEN